LYTSYLYTWSAKKHAIRCDSYWVAPLTHPIPSTRQGFCPFKVKRERPGARRTLASLPFLVRTELRVNACNPPFNLLGILLNLRTAKRSKNPQARNDLLAYGTNNTPPTTSPTKKFKRQRKKQSQASVNRLRITSPLAA